MALIGSQGGSFGLFGFGREEPRRRFLPPINIGDGLLQASFNAQISQASLAESRNILGRSSRTGENELIPPWLQEQPDESLLRQVRRVQGLETFIDTDNASFRQATGNIDQQATFTIYKALENLRILAEFASDPSTIEASLGRLDAQFQRGLAEVNQFISESPLNQLELFFGDRLSRVDSEVRLGRDGEDFSGTKTLTATPDDVIPGLNGDEIFDIFIERSDGGQNFEINLADISGPLTIRNLTDHINSLVSAPPQLDENGDIVFDEEGNQVSRFRTEFSFSLDRSAGENGEYRLEIDSRIIEKVTLTPRQSDPSLFVASSISPAVGDDAVQSRITRIDDLTGTFAASTFVTFSGIDLEGTRLAEATQDLEEDDIDPAIAARRDEFRQQAREAAGIEEEDEDDGGEGFTRSVTDVDNELRVGADTSVSGVVTDSNGNVYTIGTTAGTFGSQLNAAETSDIVLNKFDTTGNLVFSRLLGASGEAEGFAITLDANDNVIVSGRTDSALTAGDIIESTDAFVAKYNSAGDELFRFQFDRFSDSSANTVVADANGDIYVGGFTRGPISNVSGFAGGQDALLLKLDGTNGRLLDSRRFGTSGNEEVRALAIASDGQLLVATEEAGSATLRKLDTANLSSQTFNVNIGALGLRGSIEGIAVDGTNIAIVGGTQGQTLTSGGQATLVGNVSGGLDVDGFAAFFKDQGSFVTAEQTTIISSSGEDTIAGATFRGGELFVAGSTSNVLEGEKRGAVDTFIAALDASSGTVNRINQIGQTSTRSEASGIAFTENGNSVLTTLGLISGELNQDQKRDIISQSSAKAGDFFEIRIGDARARRVELREGDTFENLQRRLRIIGSRFLEVTSPSGLEGERLQIKARNRADVPDIELIAGSGGRDLLSKIGIQPGKLVPQARALNLNLDEDGDGTRELGGSFGLDLGGFLGISSKGAARQATTRLEGAIATIQRAFRSLTPNPFRDQLRRGGGGPVPPRIQARIADFQTALSRLQSGPSSGQGGLSLFL